MLTFSQALEHLKNGVKMQRTGWNGKGMYLTYYSPAKEHPTFADAFETTNGTYPLLPFILMKTADNMFVPWLASQTDILATDWQTAA